MMGIGDVAEHERMTAWHRAAARADRQQAQHVHDQAMDPETQISEQARTPSQPPAAPATRQRRSRTRESPAAE